MLKVDKATNGIKLTRGDTGIIDIALTNENGKPFKPVTGDVIMFHMSKKPGGELNINKSIPIDTMRLTIEPNDTKQLAFGDYWYDIELTDHDGDVSTVLLGKFTVTKEVG